MKSTHHIVAFSGHRNFDNSANKELSDAIARLYSEGARTFRIGMAEGFDLVSGGTDNHLMLVDLRKFNVTGKEMEHRLDEVNITVNKNAIPNDPQTPFVTSGIRVGTPAVTSRGFGKDEMLLIAKWMKLVATDFEANKAQIKAEVEALCARFPIYE